MEWQVEHPIVVMIMMFVIAVFVGVVAGFVTQKMAKNPMTATLITAISTAIASSFIYPTITHSLNLSRESRQRYLNARARHFDELRPLLLKDADRLERISETIGQQGFYEGHTDNVQAEEWYSHILHRDFRQHFASFASAREQLREKVARLDNDVRAMVRGIEEQFNIPADRRERSQQMALSLVRQCLGTAQPPRFEQTAKSYAFFDGGIGGGESNSGQPAPPYWVAAWDAYQKFRSAEEFKAQCSELTGRGRSLRDDFKRIAEEARILASAHADALQGECQYLPKRA